MKKFLWFLMLMAGSLGAIAQERSVSGRVTSSEDGSALPGVNVVLKGTASGTVTDADGTYRISVPSTGAVLVFSFIGFQSQEVSVGDQAVMDISLLSESTQLTEVVVTALGVKREVKSLPYASQQITSEKLAITRANNVNDALSGKIAGVQVRNQSGMALGRNSTVRIRGAGSLTDKAPLYVLDGTPVNSLDVNPDDIETINVLKGPAATALYGQRGDAGVIIMTSKRGTKGKGLGITINQNVMFENLYILPKYQNSYAGGAYADLVQFNYDPSMPTEWQALDGEYYHDYTDDGSWGPRMVGQDYIPWYAWIPGTKYTGQTAKLVAQPDNIRDFYETGVNSTTNVSFSKAAEDYNFRLSFTNQNINGVMPNSGLNKNTLSTQISTNLSKLVTVGANVNYVGQKLTGEFDDGYSNQSSGSFNQWFHRNLDMNILKELSNVRSPGGRLVSWNHFNPDYYKSEGDKFYRGYYWWNHFAYFDQIDYQNFRDRLFGDVNLTFNITDNFKVAGFYRKSQVTTNYENKRPSILPYSFQTELRPTSQPQWDYYGTGETFFKEDNMEVLATFNDRFMDDRLSVIINAGGNIRMEKYSEVLANTVDGLVVPDLFTLSNSRKQPFASSNFRSEKEVRSLYGFGSFGYSDIVFLDWSLRNDWSSALPADNNSYLYPSVGTSFIFSELTEEALPFLSFGKFRASWAQVGSDLAAYSTSLTYAVGTDQWNGNIVTATPNRQVDPNIKPSLSSAYELGIDLKFLKNRAGFNFTYYSESKVDEILEVPISGTSGYTSKLINAGQIDRSGIEVTLEGNPVQAGAFRWDVTLNLARQRSEIVELTEGIDAVPFGSGDVFGVAAVYNAVGEEWGQIRGFGITYKNGQPVLNSSGLYVTTPNMYHGSVLPDFTGGLINSLTYKNFALTFNIDFQSGGKFWSLSDAFGTFSGLTARTAGLNEAGVPTRDAVADGGGVHVVGIDETTEAPVEYDIEAKEYYQQFFNSSIVDNSLYDLSFVKLREVNLSYMIPVAKLGVDRVFTSASVGFVARNLWLMYSKVDDFDPAEISAAFGENGQFPSIRSYGFNLKLNF